MLKTHKEDEWDILLNSLDPNGGSLYKLNKCLLKTKQASHTLAGPNGVIYSAKNKAELIPNSLEI